MEHLCNENKLTFLQQALTFQDQFSMCWYNADPSESAVFSTRKEISVTCGCWPCQLFHELNVSLRMMYFSLPLKAKWLYYDFRVFFLTFLNVDKSLKLWPQCTQEIWNYKGIKQYPQVFNFNSFTWSFVFLGKRNWCRTVFSIWGWQDCILQILGVMTVFILPIFPEHWNSWCG